MLSARKIGGHKSFSWGHWYSCFRLLVTSALGFKARVDFLLARFLACVLFLRFTSGATPADGIEISMAVGHIPYIHVAEVGCRDSNGRHPAQQADSISKLTLINQSRIILFNRIEEDIDGYIDAVDNRNT